MTIQSNANEPFECVPGIMDFSVICSGALHSLAIKIDGTLWAWGWNYSGQLGDGTLENRTTPIKIDSGFVAIAAGSCHSMALKADGSFSGFQSIPVKIGSDFIAIAGGGAHSMAIKADETLWTCGSNEYGQLGDGTTQGKTLFVQIK